jgi:hypothetical protein
MWLEIGERNAVLEEDNDAEENTKMWLADLK